MYFVLLEQLHAGQSCVTPMPDSPAGSKITSRLGEGCRQAWQELEKFSSRSATAATMGCCTN